MNNSDKTETENGETPAAKPRIMRKVSEIPEYTYAAQKDGHLYNFNPTTENIQQAIDAGQLEERGYQTHKDELHTEWTQGAQGNIETFCLLQRDYHARRIARFVVKGWSDPIILASDGDMIDGTHRLKAAIHKHLDEVEVQVETPQPTGTQGA